MTVLLRLEHLRKAFGPRLLLDIDRLEIAEGACLVLSGRNGAGKTTLLKILAGLEPPDRLDLHFNGRTLPWHRLRGELRRELVYLHQHPYLFDADVSDNIAYGLRRAGLPEAHIQARVAEALAWAGLGHLARQNARRLSGGEKQRVALLRARVLNPRLLLLDEPFANMDLESREQTLYYLRRLRDEGITTVVTAHEPEVARLLGDHHIHLCQTGPCRYTLVEPFIYQRPSGTPPPATDSGPDAMPEATAPLPRDGASATPLPREQITGAILAGGLGRRLAGQDKGLVSVQGIPLVQRVIAVLQPQVGALVINANRNLAHYRRFGLPVVPDFRGDFFGPLVGMASVLQASDSPFLLTAPCDSPLLPADLCERLWRALQRADAQVSVVHDGHRLQPVFALLRRELLPDLLGYIERGGRKIDTWYAEHRLALADFSDRPEAFLNVNTEQEWGLLEQRLQAAGGH